MDLLLPFMPSFALVNVELELTKALLDLEATAGITSLHLLGCCQACGRAQAAEAGRAAGIAELCGAPAPAVPNACAQRVSWCTDMSIPQACWASASTVTGTCGQQR